MPPASDWCIVGILGSNQGERTEPRGMAKEAVRFLGFRSSPRTPGRQNPSSAGRCSRAPPTSPPRRIVARRPPRSQCRSRAPAKGAPYRTDF
eukprot:1177432-Prorocentrum_minimum.AAC.2